MVGHLGPVRATLAAALWRTQISVEKIGRQKRWFEGFGLLNLLGPQGLQGPPTYAPRALQDRPHRLPKRPKTANRGPKIANIDPKSDPKPTKIATSKKNQFSYIFTPKKRAEPHTHASPKEAARTEKKSV